MRQKTPVKTYADFAVGNVQIEQLGKLIIAFNRQITALVKQRSNIAHMLGGSIKIFRLHFTATDFGRRHRKTFQHLYQVGRRAAAEPVRV